MILLIVLFLQPVFRSEYLLELQLASKHSVAELARAGSENCQCVNATPTIPLALLTLGSPGLYWRPGLYFVWTPPPPPPGF